MKSLYSARHTQQHDHNGMSLRGPQHMVRHVRAVGPAIPLLGPCAGNNTNTNTMSTKIQNPTNPTIEAVKNALTERTFSHGQLEVSSDKLRTVNDILALLLLTE